MAIYYFRNVGTDWNTAANWSTTDGGGATGAVPTAADDAYFTSNSGSCTVSTASRVCKTLIFSGVGAGNYSNTFTLNNTLTVSGNVTLSSTMTFAGTSTLTVNTTSTLTSNGTTMTCGLTVSGASVTLTLGDNLTINGDFRIGAQTITGNTLYIGGGLIQTASGITSTLNSNIEMIGTGNISVGTSGASFGGTGTLTINTGGIITITGLSFSGNRSFVYVAGTINVTGNVNFINTSGTLTLDMKGYPLSPPAANTLSLATNGGTISFLTDFVVERGIFQFGNSVLAASQVCVLNTSGGNLYLGKANLPSSILNAANSISNTGTATIYIRGGGVCNYSIAAAMPLNVVFDFVGVLRVNNSTAFGNETTGMSLSTGTYTFLNGRFISQNNALVKNQGRLDITGSATIIGFDKLSGIGNIRITNGVTLTMDKFFAGRPDCISNVFCATATGSYTVTFQDDSEKLANWVRVSNCTLSRRGQLLILNQRGVNNTARNTGVRYINSWPNGAPKHSPFTPDNSTTYGAGGLLADPAIAL
jgi:hypothetical protein